MSKSFIGANVMFCGHRGHFIADIHVVGNCNVVRASREVTPDNIDRTMLHNATHHISDFPTAGFWRPDLGVFVVPQAQVVELSNENRSKYV
jgi:hypothetical protein